LNEGRGRFNKIVDFILTHKTGSYSDYETFVHYLQLNNPLDLTIERRLVFHNSTDDLKSSLTNSSSIVWRYNSIFDVIVVIIPSVFVTLIVFK